MPGPRPFGAESALPYWEENLPGDCPDRQVLWRQGDYLLTRGLQGWRAEQTEYMPKSPGLGDPESTMGRRELGRGRDSARGKRGGLFES